MSFPDDRSFLFQGINAKLAADILAMFNWKTVLGFILLFAGIIGLYTILGNHVKSSPIAAETGCVIWMGVGILFVIRGMGNGDKQ